MARYLVSHPHAAAFANAVAGGLEAQGHLDAYVTGFAASARSVRGLVFHSLAQWKPRVNNRLLPDVAAEHLLSLGWVEGMARLFPRVSQGRTSAYDAMFVGHDAVVSMLPWSKRLTDVYAFEDGAASTFVRARRAGLRTTYDLPIPHYAALERMWTEQARQWPEALTGPVPVEPDWKKRRKDAELAHSDRVVVASSHTQSSLLARGFGGRVIVNPYGFPGPPFVPKPRAPRGPFTALAVGTQDLRKGTPLLLEAWRRASIPGGRLRIVGRMAVGTAFLSGYSGHFEHVPPLARTQLVAEYQAADVLVFPTLGDGFGMVISEAMACGTPVITTPHGGGPEVITSGVDGVIVPAGNVDALVEALRAAAENRDALAAMGARAAARAQSYSWAKASANLSAQLEARSVDTRGTSGDVWA